MWVTIIPSATCVAQAWTPTIGLNLRLMELGHEGMRDQDGQLLFAVTDEQGAEVPIWEWEHYYDVNVVRDRRKGV